MIKRFALISATVAVLLAVLAVVAHPVSAGANLPQPVAGEFQTPVTTTLRYYYFPLIAGVDPTVASEFALDDYGYVSSLGSNYAQALAGTGQVLFTLGNYSPFARFRAVQASDPNDAGIQRSTLEFNTSALTNTEIVSAELVLTIKAVDGYGYSIADFAVHQGTWTTLNATPQQLWSAWDTTPLVTQTAVVSGTVLHLSIPPTAINLSGPTRLLVRLAGDAIEPAPHWYFTDIFPRATTSLKVYHRPIMPSSR